MIDLKEIQHNLLRHLEEITASLRNAELPTTCKTHTINGSQIRESTSVEQLSQQLPKKGNHIYWIEVSRPDILLTQFKEKPSAVSYKCARDNQSADSQYVYVGSCTKTKLGNRFKQHFGWGNDQTYALHLAKWISNDDLIFTFSYVEIENDLLVQYLEDQMHKELKPMFGKPGGNNKVKGLS
ncbi:hypothetical protein [Spirosoma agri]|uniref:Uncharacterized protein n=1 Tax=Spirosoma agri TaxID=1987381 RepID=A0A6M0IEB2_9BACT|nr:hypothetical protein [Spirosoma agri]NEU66599.1 hypothetical protein [Spirosoma agri]